MSISRRGWLAMLGAAALACVGVGKKHKGKTLTADLWLCQEAYRYADGSIAKFMFPILAIKPLEQVSIPSKAYTKIEVPLDCAIGTMFPDDGFPFEELRHMTAGESMKIRLTIEVLE